MRLLVTTTLALCFIQSNAPSPTPGKATQPEQQKAAAEQQNPPNDNHPSSNSPAAVQQPSTQVTSWNERDAGENHEAKAASDRWSLIFAGIVAACTFALAVFALMQWLVLRQQRIAMNAQAGYMERQWETMEKQLETANKNADAAHRSADAAKKSADALINSERAWVMVDVTWQSGRGREILGQAGDSVSTNMALTLTCRNEGRTPAWSTSKMAAVRIVEHVPRYEDMSPSTKGPIAGDFIEVCTEPLSVGQQPSVKHFTVTCNGRKEKGRFPMIFGVVEYRDVFEPNRTTSFGYIVTDDYRLERIAGVDRYSDYNKNT